MAFSGALSAGLSYEFSPERKQKLVCANAGTLLCRRTEFIIGKIGF